MSGARSRVWLDPVDMTVTADAQTLGLPGTQMGTPEDSSGPTMLKRQPVVDPPDFQTEKLTGGHGIVQRFIARLGGTFGVPQGPPPTHARVMAVKADAANAPAIVENIPRMPATAEYVPSFDSYLTDYR